MNICSLIYGKRHHFNGKANAFRHALWNILISQKVISRVHNEEKAVQWAQRLTDLHEELAPNKPLEKAMDLHNNHTGRIFFYTLKTSSQKEILTFLKQKTNQAKYIASVTEIDSCEGELVYIEEVSGSPKTS